MTKRDQIYSAAKRRALSQLAFIEPDTPAPEYIRFQKGAEGFTVSMILYAGDEALEVKNMMSWTALEMGGVMQVAEVVKQMLKALAREAAEAKDE